MKIFVFSDEYVPDEHVRSFESLLVLTTLIEEDLDFYFFEGNSFAKQAVPLCASYNGKGRRNIIYMDLEPELKNPVPEIFKKYANVITASTPESPAFRIYHNLKKIMDYKTIIVHAGNYEGIFYHALQYAIKKKIAIIRLGGIEPNILYQSD